MMKKRQSKDSAALQIREGVEQQIITVRGFRVMLDRVLAILYGVTTKRLNEQVKRNRDRFPEDFMFRLTVAEGKEAVTSRSQSATLKQGANLKYGPYVFTEHGAVMLASVLNSKVAVEASIRVVRAFVRLRTILALHQDFANQLESLEKKYESHDQQFKTVFAALRQLLSIQPASPGRQIGFRTSSKKR